MYGCNLYLLANTQKDLGKKGASMYAMTVPTLAFMPFRVLHARKVIVWLREVHREHRKQSICFVNKPLYRGCKYSHVRL